MAPQGQGTYTVGMYSPGKALVVYEMRRHVCDRGQKTALVLYCALSTHLSDSTVTCHHTLELGISHRSCHVSFANPPRTFRDCVACAAIVTVRVYPINGGFIVGDDCAI